jgi:hypothetical protein
MGEITGQAQVKFSLLHNVSLENRPQIWYEKPLGFTVYIHSAGTYIGWHTCLYVYCIYGVCAAA